MPPPVAEDWAGWRLEERDDRYNAFLSHFQFHMMPAMSPVGFAVVKTPEHVHSKLKDFLDAHKDQQELPQDYPTNVITPGETPPVFIHNQALNNEVMHDVKHVLEEWVSMPLVPSAAHGLRVYRPGNVLKWHVDRLQTHIVSTIVHVDRDSDEPWPLWIEDIHGTIHHVDVKPGEMILYESAKLPHARPIPFTGRFYTSLFVHYRPVNWDMSENTFRELVGLLLPRDWDRPATKDHTEL